eukprot:gene10062-13522_t
MSEDDFAELTGPVILDEEENLPTDMPLSDIINELNEITDLANKELPYDENRLDYLLKIRENHPEYIELKAIEREEWLESVEQFIYQCQERVRTFVPVDVFSMSYDDLIGIGLTPEVAKRILQKKCLWLVRMSTAEIARLHESDLLNRYNSAGQNLDIIETAAVFASLPDTFSNDTTGKKSEWRDVLEFHLKKMLKDHEEDRLPEHKVRAPAYGGIQFGPVRDISTVREYKINATNEVVRKKSFIEVCTSAAGSAKIANYSYSSASNSSDLDF